MLNKISLQLLTQKIKNAIALKIIAVFAACLMYSNTLAIFAPSSVLTMVEIGICCGVNSPPGCRCPGENYGSYGGGEDKKYDFNYHPEWHIPKQDLYGFDKPDFKINQEIYDFPSFDNKHATHLAEKPTLLATTKGVNLDKHSTNIKQLTHIAPKKSGQGLTRPGLNNLLKQAKKSNWEAVHNAVKNYIEVTGGETFSLNKINKKKQPSKESVYQSFYNSFVNHGLAEEYYDSCHGASYCTDNIRAVFNFFYDKTSEQLYDLLTNNTGYKKGKLGETYVPGLAPGVGGDFAGKSFSWFNFNLMFLYDAVPAIYAQKFTIEQNKLIDEQNNLVEKVNKIVRKEHQKYADQIKSEYKEYKKEVHKTVDDISNKLNKKLTTDPVEYDKQTIVAAKNLSGILNKKLATNYEQHKKNTLDNANKISEKIKRELTEKKGNYQKKLSKSINEITAKLNEMSGQAAIEAGLQEILDHYERKSLIEQEKLEANFNKKYNEYAEEADEIANNALVELNKESTENYKKYKKTISIAAENILAKLNENLLKDRDRLFKGNKELPKTKDKYKQKIRTAQKRLDDIAVEEYAKYEKIITERYEKYKKEVIKTTNQTSTKLNNGLIDSYTECINELDETINTSDTLLDTSRKAVDARINNHEETKKIEKSWAIEEVVLQQKLNEMGLSVADREFIYIKQDIIEFVKERAIQEKLMPELLQDVVSELTEEDFVRNNLDKLSEHYENGEFSATELKEVLSGKLPIKDANGEVKFVELTKGINDTQQFISSANNNLAIKESIKDEWREAVADTGELLISFIPIAGPPISVAFSQLIKGEFDIKELFQGLAWGTADLAGVGFLKRIKNIEKTTTTISRITKIKITKSTGWKVGEDYNKLTAKGTEPAWNTVKRRFWKNKAATLTTEEVVDLEAKMAGNVKRMKQGKPPQKFSSKKYDRYGDGRESKELHHNPIPKRDGGKLVEDLWPEEHAAKDEFRNLGY